MRIKLFQHDMQLRGQVMIGKVEKNEGQGS